jgi:ankyrin repeat protein
MDPEPLRFLDSPEEFRALFCLQEFMMSLTTKHIDEQKCAILNSEWVTDPKTVRQLAASIIVAARVRASTIPALATLVHSLSAPDSPDSPLNELPRFVFSGIFRELSDTKPFPNESALFSLLFECFRKGIFPATDIFPHLRFFLKDGIFLRSASWLFCYFAPEIEKLDSELYDQTVDAMTQAIARPQFPQIFKNFANKLSDLRKNDWRVLRKRRQYFLHRTTLLSKIRTDDLPALQAAALAPTFNIEMRILPTPFMPSTLLQGHPTLIQVAALFGAVKCFTFLLANGAQLQTADHNVVRLAQFAIAGGNIEIIRLCQQHDVDFFGALHTAVTFHRNDLFDWLCSHVYPDSTVLDLSGHNLLHTACEYNNLYAMRRVVEAGVDVNDETFNEWTPLRIAVRRGLVDPVRFLLSVPSLDINPRSRAGVTPFHLTAKRGDLTIAAYLVARDDVDVDSSSEDGMTPLFHAIMGNHPAFVAFLLELPGVDVNRRGPDNFTPLMASLMYDLQKISKLLIKNPRVDINAGIAPLCGPTWLAVKLKRMSALKCLLKRPDLDLSERSEEGFSLLHLAVRESSVPVIEMLLKYGAVDVNALDSQMVTPLHLAASLGQAETVKVLLTAPTVDVNIQTATGNTALHFAAAYGFYEIAELLLDRSETDVNVPATVGATPLHAAVQNCHVAIVKALCQRPDLDVNAKTVGIENVTALIFAACKANAEIVEELLRYPGIDVGHTMTDGRTALTVAMAKRAPAVVDLIRQWIEAKTPPRRRSFRASKKQEKPEKPKPESPESQTPKTEKKKKGWFKRGTHA